MRNRSNIIKVKIRRVGVDPSDIPLPKYESEYAAGLDLRAAIEEPITLHSGERLLLPTGIAIELPAGYEAQVRPRSGLAIKHGIALVNSPGTIDADYRGEIKIIMINLGTEDLVIQRGDRIAQMVVAPVPRVEWVVTEELTDTARGTGGFGHTGTRKPEKERKGI